MEIKARMFFSAQTTILTSRPGTTTTFFAGLPSMCFLGHLRGQRGGLDLLFCGRGRHLDGAAQLAVYLQHQFDLVLRQRGFERLRPRRLQDVPIVGLIAQLAPQMMADMGA
jgi:hypothetical protein